MNGINILSIFNILICKARYGLFIVVLDEKFYCIKHLRFFTAIA